jgi:hypothetical protein
MEAFASGHRPKSNAQALDCIRRIIRLASSLLEGWSRPSWLRVLQVVSEGTEGERPRSSWR